MIALLWMVGLAFALDVNDQLKLQLDGGEVIEGWFVRAEPAHIVIHVSALGASSRIPLAMLDTVEINGVEVSSQRFEADVQVAHEQWLQWRAAPPPHPSAGVVAFTSVLMAGSGHAWLGDWENAPGLLLADSIGMGVTAWELKNKQRLNVVFGAVTVSAIMKLYAASNGARKARARRRKLGLDQKR